MLSSAQIKTMIPVLAVFLLLLLFGRKAALSRSFQINYAALLTNRAIQLPHLDFQARLMALDTVAQKLPDKWSAFANQESIQLMAAATFLHQSSDYADKEPGPQLLNNPDFNHDLAGWVQYNSHWHRSATNQPPNDETTVAFAQNGEGHSSLSQTLQLENDACYLFSVTASVERRDDIPTYWFYLETYDETGKPNGQSLERFSGSQNWAHRFAPFCLPGSSGTTTKVTVAPVNLYGDATVYLGAVRLYRLLPSRK